MKRLAVCLLNVTAGVFALTAQAQCTLTNIGLAPLPDFGLQLYNGYAGGLYPNARNNPPPEHLEAGLDIALNKIAPLNASGNVDTNNGKIVLISVGMSNTTHEFGSGDRNTNDRTKAFKYRADSDPSKNPHLIIVDGAQGGQDALQFTNPAASTWNNVRSRLNQAGVNSNQVQVCWVKQSLKDITQYGAFPANALVLQDALEQIVRNLQTLFPNIKLVYVSSRTRAYTVSPSATNPEPTSWETGFATKWMIARQIGGAPDLNFDPARGAVRAPLLLWGPYLWVDGTVPRSDRLLWECNDLVSDLTHPSSNGVYKVASQLLAFFKTDPTATPWFLKKTLVGQPPSCSVSADVTNGITPLTVNFAADASDADGTIRDYQWTFDDGTFGTNANPTKIFKMPGIYTARVTVTDNDGNNVTRSLFISVAGVALSSPAIIGKEMQMNVLGATDYNYVVQRSENLTNWFPVITNRGPFTFTSTNSGPSRFYRAVLEP